MLLVEVEGQRRQLLAEYLGKNHHVTAAKDGDEALELLKHTHFDLVLADRHLPGGSGLRVIEHAQRLLPHCASVLYTAYPSYDSVQEAFAVGVDAYLVRPNDDLEEAGREGRGSARRPRRNPVRLKDGSTTCASLSPTTCAFRTAKTKRSSTAPRPCDAIAAGLRAGGHEVEKIEVTGPASRLAERIESFSPDLIFNTAEGRRGRAREAFYPALFEELGFAYTGSDAYVLTVTLDKWLTKLVLAQKGIDTPRGAAGDARRIPAR